MAELAQIAGYVAMISVCLLGTGISLGLMVMVGLLLYEDVRSRLRSIRRRE